MISHQFVIDVQKSLVIERGLSTEISDTGKLQAALMRVENRIQYGIIKTPIEVAAWYAAAIARGHCFPDANKRTAYVVLITYLAKQGYDLPMDQADQLEDKIVELASGSLDPDGFAVWLTTVTNGVRVSNQ